MIVSEGSTVVPCIDGDVRVFNTGILGYIFFFKTKIVVKMNTAKSGTITEIKFRYILYNFTFSFTQKILGKFP